MMPPRQRNPFQGPPMGGRMQGMRGPSGFPGPQMRGGAPSRGSNGGSGGILSKLFGGGNNAGTTAATQGARSAASGSGGLLKSLTNPTAINGFLANSQKFLNTASQIGPMINQYGPMVRNIPAMWKLYRGLKGNGSDSEETSVTADTNEPSKTKTSQSDSVQMKKKGSKDNSTIEINETIDDFDVETLVKPVKGASKPKLYV